MRTVFALMLTSLIVLAWQERKNKLVLFGSIAVILALGAAVTIGRFPSWITSSLGIATFGTALIAFGFAVKRVLNFTMRKLADRRH